MTLAVTVTVEAETVTACVTVEAAHDADNCSHSVQTCSVVEHGHTVDVTTSVVLRVASAKT